MQIGFFLVAKCHNSFSLHALSGLQEGLGQHHAGYSWPGDLLQVMLREEVRPQRIRLRPGSGDAQHGPGGAAGNQTRRVSWPVDGDEQEDYFICSSMRLYAGLYAKSWRVCSYSGVWLLPLLYCKKMCCVTCNCTVIIKMPFWLPLTALHQYSSFENSMSVSQWVPISVDERDS